MGSVRVHGFYLPWGNFLMPTTEVNLPRKLGYTQELGGGPKLLFETVVLMVTYRIITSAFNIEYVLIWV